MKTILLAAVLGLGAQAAAFAQTPSPEAAWKAGIREQNKDYSAVPHAMLKIQDAAYLGEGQSAVLVGVVGQPGSWHWSQDNKARGPVTIAFAHGSLAVMHGGKPVDGITKSIPVDKDIDIAGQPTQVGAGIQGWRIFIYNQQNPAAKNFTSVSYFPYDEAFRVVAQFAPDPKLPGHAFRTSRGTDKMFYHAGDAHFMLRGKAVTLPFYADSGDGSKIKDMSAFFTDALTGKGAYGAGRYVDVAGIGKFPPSRVTIDFNTAYNPNCARSAFFTCPVAIDAIALAMTVGERDPHAH